MLKERRMEEVLRRVPQPYCPQIQQVMSDSDLLMAVKKKFDINQIFYPGCWTDTKSLEEVFKARQIVYMDRDQDIIYKRDWSFRQLVVGDMKRSPFVGGLFDAIFVQDSHLSDREFRGTLGTLKVGGVLIFSTQDCGNMCGIQPDKLLRMRRRLNVVPIHSDYFLPFVKR